MKNLNEYYGTVAYGKAITTIKGMHLCYPRYIYLMNEVEAFRKKLFYLRHFV